MIELYEILQHWDTDDGIVYHDPTDDDTWYNFATEIYHPTAKICLKQLLFFVGKTLLHLVELSDLLFISEIHDQPDDEEADKLHTGYDQKGNDIAYPAEQQRYRDEQQYDQRAVQRRSRRQRHSLDLVKGHSGKASRAVQA